MPPCSRVVSHFQFPGKAKRSSPSKTNSSGLFTTISWPWRTVLHFPAKRSRGAIISPVEEPPLHQIHNRNSFGMKIRNTTDAVNTIFLRSTDVTRESSFVRISTALRPLHLLELRLGKPPQESWIIAATRTREPSHSDLDMTS